MLICQLILMTKIFDHLIRSKRVKNFEYDKMIAC